MACWLRAAAMVLIAAFALPAMAASFTSGPYTFSDELGGFRLISVSGTGTQSDPIIVVEELLDSGPAVLTVTREVDRLPSGSLAFPSSLRIEKVVTNSSRRPWIGFDLELEEVRGMPSSHEDGLSFDEVSKRTGVLDSTRFTHAERMFDPGDRVTFFEGGVDHTDTVRFTLFITDTSPSGTFYLVQRPRFAMASLRDDQHLRNTKALRASPRTMQTVQLNER